jgi:hypothetical protein
MSVAIPTVSAATPRARRAAQRDTPSVVAPLESFNTLSTPFIADDGTVEDLYALLPPPRWTAAALTSASLSCAAPPTASRRGRLGRRPAARHRHASRRHARLVIADGPGGLGTVRVPGLNAKPVLLRSPATAHAPTLLACVLSLSHIHPLPLSPRPLAAPAAMPHSGGYIVWVHNAIGPALALLNGMVNLLCSVFDCALYPLLLRNTWSARCTRCCRQSRTARTARAGGASLHPT